MAIEQYCPTQEICKWFKKSKYKGEFALRLVESENKVYCTALENLGMSQDDCFYIFQSNRDLRQNPLPEPKLPFDPDPD